MDTTITSEDNQQRRQNIIGSSDGQQSQQVVTTRISGGVGDEDISSLTSSTTAGVSQQQQQLPKDHSSATKKTFSTLKEENDKLRTYLGLVKMCNNSAIAKIKASINDTISTINSAGEVGVDSAIIVRQLEVIQNEIINMQSIHTQLDEGVDAFLMTPDNNMMIIAKTGTVDPFGGDLHNKEKTTTSATNRYDIPRKSTGIRKSKSKTAAKLKSTKDHQMNAKLLNRVIDNRTNKPSFGDNIQMIDIRNEESEAVANIEHNTSPATVEERENVSQVMTIPMTTDSVVLQNKMVKKPHISDEFKSSHNQRLIEAKRRREEMNRQMEREGKRKPKSKRLDDRLRTVTEITKNNNKKRPIKKKIIGKTIKKKSQQPMLTGQSIVLPISQSTLDSLAGQTIQIIASGGTQILCRSDGTFIPATNASQWPLATTNTQWAAAAATTDSNNSFTTNQWNQYQT